MNKIAYVENLLKNYQEIKGQIEHFKNLTLEIPYESITETIQSLNFKDVGVYDRGRSP